MPVTADTLIVTATHRQRHLPVLGDGHKVNVAGLVITKQRPGTASGVIFVTLEDETGQINLVVWKQVAEQYRAELLNARLLGVAGELQIEGQVIHVVAQRLFDHSDLLGDLERTFARLSLVRNQLSSSRLKLNVLSRSASRCSANLLEACADLAR